LQTAEVSDLANSKLSSFLFGESPNLGKYALVAVRLVIAAFWINAAIPRWTELLAGHPQASGLVRNLFGAGMVVPLTYVFTILETLGAIALLLGLATRLTCVWAVVEFAITGTTGVLGGNVGLAKDFGLLAGALVLLFNGSRVLSVDGLLAKQRAGR